LNDSPAAPDHAACRGTQPEHPGYDRLDSRTEPTGTMPETDYLTRYQAGAHERVWTS